MKRSDVASLTDLQRERIAAFLFVLLRDCINLGQLYRAVDSVSGTNVTEYDFESPEVASLCQSFMFALVEGGFPVPEEIRNGVPADTEGGPE